MTEQDYAEAVALMRATPGAYRAFRIERDTIEAGRTFSADALDDLVALLRLWVATRIEARWEHTGEPPTVLDVSIRVEPA